MKRLVRVDGRRVYARFIGDPHKAVVMTFPTHAIARRAASRLILRYRLSQSDEEWDQELEFRTELIRAYAALEEEDS
jgi:hypothetical protein